MADESKDYEITDLDTAIQSQRQKIDFSKEQDKNFKLLAIITTLVTVLSLVIYPVSYWLLAFTGIVYAARMLVKFNDKEYIKQLDFLEKISTRHGSSGHKLITLSQAVTADEISKILGEHQSTASHITLRLTKLREGELMLKRIKSSRIADKATLSKDGGGFFYIFLNLEEDVQSGTPVDQDNSTTIDPSSVVDPLQGNSKADLVKLWYQLKAACATDTKQDVIVHIHFKDISLMHLYNNFLSREFPNSGNVFITAKSYEDGFDSDDLYLQIRLDKELKGFLAADLTPDLAEHYFLHPFNIRFSTCNGHKNA